MDLRMLSWRHAVSCRTTVQWARARYNTGSPSCVYLYVKYMGFHERSVEKLTKNWRAPFVFKRFSEQYFNVFGVRPRSNENARRRKSTQGWFAPSFDRRLASTCSYQETIILRERNSVLMSVRCSWRLRLFLVTSPSRARAQTIEFAFWRARGRDRLLSDFDFFCLRGDGEVNY